jgi:hypothetical protein
MPKVGFGSEYLGASSVFGATFTDFSIIGEPAQPSVPLV